jgi:muconolactone D-isomerase
VTRTTHVPDGTPDAAVDDIRAREAAHSRELAAEGHILRLWRPPSEPGEWRSLGMFEAADRSELEEVLLSIPFGCGAATRFFRCHLTRTIRVDRLAS